VSQEDQSRWDARYREQADEDEFAASALLDDALARLSSERADLEGMTALDIACGGGRNSLRLAESGFWVDAVDVSAEGLALGERRAALSGSDEAAKRIRWIQADLDDGLPVAGSYDLIVMVRYLALSLLVDAIELLRPGGVLVVELHMDAGGEAVSGPRNPAYLVAPGALAEVTGGLSPWLLEEGVFQIGDDRREALARFVGRVPD
jgi:SAM-dependent methyltransferase